MALKERVVFVEQGGEALAIPFRELEKAGSLGVALGGAALELSWIPGVRSAFGSLEGGEGRITGSALVRSVETGEIVAFDTPFWFAVAAFRPDVRVIDAEGFEVPPHRRVPAPADLSEIPRMTARLAG